MRVLLAAIAVHLKIEAITPGVMLMTLLNPVVFGIVAMSTVGEPALALFVGVGLAAAASGVPADSVIVLMQERNWATLQQTALSPTQAGTVLLGRTVGVCLHASVSLLAAFGAFALLYGTPHTDRPVATGLAVLLGLAGLFVIGLLIIGFISRRSYRAGMPNAIFPVITLLCGFFAATDRLPQPLELSAMILPSTWAMSALRRIETGGDPVQPLLIGCVVLAITLALGVRYVYGAQEAMRTSAEAHYR